MLELGCILKEAIVNPEKNLIIVVDNYGTAYSYNVDYMPQADNVSFYLFLVIFTPYGR